MSGNKTPCKLSFVYMVVTSQANLNVWTEAKLVTMFPDTNRHHFKNLQKKNEITCASVLKARMYSYENKNNHKHFVNEIRKLGHLPVSSVV